MRSRDVIRKIEADGWFLIRVTGSHHIFNHPVKQTIAIVPHPKADLPIGTLRNISKQTGVPLP